MCYWRDRKQKKEDLGDLLRSFWVRLSWNDRCFHWMACLFGWWVKRRFSDTLWRNGVSRSNGLLLNNFIDREWLDNVKESYPSPSTSSGISKKRKQRWNLSVWEEFTLFISYWWTNCWWSGWTIIRISYSWSMTI